MISLVDTLLRNPFVQTLLVGGAGWLVRKALGKRADTRAGKAAAALAEAVSQMGQYILTEPGKTPEQVIAAFKGIVAIRFGAAGFTEAQRAPYQSLINAAIAEAVYEWAKRHPSPTALTMPVTKRLTA